MKWNGSLAVLPEVTGYSQMRTSRCGMLRVRQGWTCRVDMGDRFSISTSTWSYSAGAVRLSCREVCATDRVMGTRPAITRGR